MELDQIREVPIATVLDSMGIPHRAGKCRCPIHDERNPSFSFTGNLYNCFSCGSGGDTIGFMMSYHEVDFISAVKLIAGIANIDVGENLVIKRNYAREALLENKKILTQILLQEEQSLIDECRFLFKIKPGLAAKAYTLMLINESRLDEIYECKRTLSK